MLRLLKNQRGVAFILVIATIAFITPVVLDFFLDSQRRVQVTRNHQKRLQAYYLSKSAVNFSKLILYYNKEVDSALSKKGVSMGSLGYEPLYKMIPLDTELLRAMVDLQGIDPADLAGEGADEESQEMMENAQNSVSQLKQDDLKNFLNFPGNFRSEISEEQAKYAINAVSKMTTASESFEIHKKVLLSILKRKLFLNFFENQDYDTVQLVNNIADFIDNNGVINDFDKVERGAESSQYPREADYKVKNAPLMTLSELRLVPGMTDDIYETLKPFVSVFHTTDKINICLADPTVVDALIVHYTNYSKCTSPLDAEDDGEEIAKLREASLMGCPDKTQVAMLLNQELGLKEIDPNKGRTAETKSTSSKVADCEIQFEDFLSDKNDIFQVTTTGQVGEVAVKMTTVLDTSAKKPSQWKVLYFHLE